MTPNQKPPYYQQEGMPPIKPDNNMVWAVLSTILCCLPFGIVSIVYANKVDSLWFQGFYQEAYDNARKARNWAIAAAVTGAVFSLIGAFIYFFAAFAIMGASI